MAPPEITRRSLLAGAQGISGTAVVIDTFRAFTTAAFLFWRGADRIVLVETLDDARSRSQSIPGSILAGEESGRRPLDFDLGNSPTEAEACAELADRTVVMRTSSGTRCVVIALRSGAVPVYAASLVVADATVAAVRAHAQITIVASGLSGTIIADEDEETANLVADRLLERTDDPERVDRIRSGTGAERLRTTPWIDSADLGRCLDTDRFDFAMKAELEDGLVVLRRHDV